jgi:protein gp37
MADRSRIEWTDATWNPTTGCTRVSAGCEHCYAERLAHRLLSHEYRKQLPVMDSPANRADPFAVRLWPDRLLVPEGWTSPRRIFVNSMSDLFHKDIPEEFIRRCFEVMVRVDRHVYQVLTKRPARAARFVARNRDLFSGECLPSHIWIGTSVENQQVSYRIRHLKEVAAKVRFLSCEPLLGPINLRRELGRSGAGIHWVIVGGESGPGARPMNIAWVRRIRDACALTGVPFFFKQWGGLTPKSGGRELDGQSWDEYPLENRTVVAA